MLPRPVALAGAKGDPLAHELVLKGPCPTAPVSRRWAGPFSTSSYYKPVLKGSLTPGRKKAEVFGHFGHRLMPSFCSSGKCVVFDGPQIISKSSAMVRVANYLYKLPLRRCAGTTVGSSHRPISRRCTEASPHSPAVVPDRAQVGSPLPIELTVPTHPHEALLLQAWHRALC